MRFLVDLYRYIIFALCALTLIAVTLLVLLTLDQNSVWGAEASIYIVTGGVAVLLFLIINLGGIATLISVHDRHAELVDEATAIREALDRIASSSEAGRGFMVGRP